MSLKIKIAFILLSLIFVSLDSKAQRHRPYHSFGFSLSGNYGSIAQNRSFYYTGDYLVHEFNVSPGIAAHYDYAPYSWLGLNTGLGFDIRGSNVGRDLGFSYYIPPVRSNYFLINIPLITQIKMGNFLWFETGLEVNLQLANNNADPASYSNHGSPITTIIKYPFFSYGAIGGIRFNLFRGVSLGLHLHRGLSPLYIAYSTAMPYEKDFSGRLYDKSIHFSVRYMFKQPKNK